MGVTWTRDPNWPPPPKGTAYGLDTGYWLPVREGSNLEVPNFRPSRSVAQFPLATGKSKKYRDAALAMAFIGASRHLGYEHRRHARAIAFQSRLAILAHERLVVAACQV